MKKIVGIVLLMVVAVGIFAAAGPYIALYQIRSGVEKSDSEKIAAYVDFPALRTNLKEQLRAQMLKKESLKMKENPFDALAKGLASKMAEGMVDSFVTPAGLMKLLQGKKRGQDRNADPSSKSSEPKSNPFQDADCNYDSINKFSVRVKDNKDREIRFILTRAGLSWKLSNIILPFNG